MQVAILAAMAMKARSGDVRASEFLRDTAGENPRQKLEEKRFAAEQSANAGGTDIVKDWIDSIPDAPAGGEGGGRRRWGHRQFNRRDGSSVDFFHNRLPLYQRTPCSMPGRSWASSVTDWQRDVLRDLAEAPWVTVRSGQGVGKTGVEAVALLWFLTCFRFPRVVATAPTRQQLHDVLWSEVEKWRSNSPLLREILRWTKPMST